MAWATKASAVVARAVPLVEAVKKVVAWVAEQLRVEPPRNGDVGPRVGDTWVWKWGVVVEEVAQLVVGGWVALRWEGERLAWVATVVRVGLYPICRFRKTATKYVRKSGIKWLRCTAK